MSQEQSIIQRVLVKCLLGSVVQIVFYVLALHMVWFVSSCFFKSSPEIPDNFYTLLSIMIFGSMVLMQNLLDCLVNRKWFRVTLFLLVFAIYCIGWGEDTDSFPFSALVSIPVGFLSLLFKVFLDKKIDQRFAALQNSRSS